MATPVLKQLITLEGAQQIQAQARQLADGVEGSFQRIKTSVEGAGTGAESFAQNLFNISDRAIAVGAVVATLGVVVFKLGQKFVSVASDAAKAGAALGRAADSLGQNLGNFQKSGFALQQIGLTHQEAGQAIEKFGAGAAKGYKEATDKLKAAGLLFAPTAEGAAAAARQLGALGDQAARSGEKLTPFQEVLSRSRAEFDKTTAALKLTPEAWQTFADSINKIKDPADRVNKLMEIFGEGLGRRLAIALKDGGVGLKAAFEDFQRLGLGLTEEQRKVADGFEKAQARLAAVREKANRDSGLALAPFLTPLLDGLATGIADFNKKIDEQLLIEIKTVKEAWQGLKDIFNGEFDFSRVWSGLSESFNRELEAIKRDLQNTVAQLTADWEALTSVISSAVDKIREFFSISQASGTEGGAGTGTDFNPGGFASGGLVHGPGTATSDSILARLSRGEFVINARAVDHFGPAFFAALNRMRMPGFSFGGLVSSINDAFAIPRFADGGLVTAGAGSTKRVLVDLRTNHGMFSGLSGSEDVVDAFARKAVSSRIARTGKSSSWKR